MATFNESGLRYDFSDFADFWPFYLSRHMNRTNRHWHFAGITGTLILLVSFVATGSILLLPIALASSYFPAWVGHFGYEKNVPASFQYPILSVQGDLYMYWRMWTRKLSFDFDRHRELITNFRRVAEQLRASRAGTS